MKIRLATRQSPLALWQAHHVADLLRTVEPGIDVQLIPASTVADERLDLTIAELGGKGAFATQIQAMVAAGQADAAVHSAKDLPSTTAPGLVLAAVPQRGNPFDVLVGSSLQGLAEGATVRTGSSRRRVQLQRVRPDLIFEELRGNIATRLNKIPDGGAIVMAAAAFERLGIAEPTPHPLPTEVMVPQVGQGSLAIECRSDDSETAALLKQIEHSVSRIRLDVEREFLQELGGDCELPAGAFTEDPVDDGITISGVLADPSGYPLFRASITAPITDRPGRVLAEQLQTLIDGN